MEAMTTRGTEGGNAGAMVRAELAAARQPPARWRPTRSATFAGSCPPAAPPRYRKLRWPVMLGMPRMSATSSEATPARSPSATTSATSRATTTNRRARSFEPLAWSFWPASSDVRRGNDGGRSTAGTSGPIRTNRGGRYGRLASRSPVS